jgi:4-hydroxybenzoate polyprenyltransferase
LPRLGDEPAQASTGRRRWMPRVRATLADYARLMRLDRPVGILLLLWPTLWALWLASQGKPDPHILVVFVAGVVLMRAAGCVINDYADRAFDPHVARTKDRPLAAGRIVPVEALLLFAALSLSALGLALQLNRFTLLFAVAGAFLAVTYPFIKRFLSVPQLYLGVSFGWGIPMAFAAQLEHVPRVAWLLFLANLLWVTVYDTIYAMVDRDDDLKIGVRSTAILFGDSDRHIIAILQAMTLLSFVLVGRMLQLGIWYWVGLAAGAACFAYHLWLIRNRERAACFRAFRINHYFGMAVFIGILLNYIYK